MDIKLSITQMGSIRNLLRLTSLPLSGSWTLFTCHECYNLKLICKRHLVVLTVAEGLT